MSARNFYHGRRKWNPAPLHHKLHAKFMFFFALAVMFAAALYKNSL